MERLPKLPSGKLLVTTSLDTHKSFCSHNSSLKFIPSERASQEEQNGAKFSFIAPSSEELWVPILVSHSKCTRMVKVVTAADFTNAEHS